MTNSNDFRRYSYLTDIETVNAINAFSLTRSSAAPKYEPEPSGVKKRKPLRVKSANEALKTREELLADQRRAAKQVICVLIILGLTVSMFFGMLFTYVKKNEYTREIAALKTELSREINQNICTNAELDALVSIEQIEDYAVNKLGMVKAQSQQVKYIDVEQYKQQREAALQKRQTESDKQEG